MKKHSWVILALLVCSLFAVSSTQAALIGSRHDMTTATGYGGTGIGTAGPCSFCHIPHKATGAKAWAAGVGGTAAVIGTVGQLCYDCHNAGGKFASAATVTAVDVFNVTSFHGLTRGNLPALDNMASSGLPYATTALTTGLIECSTCHDPHNTAQEPFLNSLGTDINVLCGLCHGGRSATGEGYQGNTTGTHPVGIAPNASSTKSPVTVPTDNMARALRLTTSVSGPGGGLAWLAGGHLSSGATGNLTCNTCHGIHGRQPNQSPQVASATFTDNTSGTAVKALLNMGNGLLQSGFCEACHGVVTPAASGTANVKGPGGTGTFSHPINVTAATVDTTVFVAANPPYNYGTNKPLCRACHGVHARTASPRASVVYTPILYQRHNPASGTAFCLNCHPATASFFTLGKHHLSGSANWGDIASMKANAQATTPLLDNANWFIDTAGAQSVPAGIVCYNCHRAHNAPDNVSVLRMVKGPGFTQSAYDPAIQWQNGCVGCHTAYPSTYTANDNGSGASKGSHFVGTLRNIPAGFANTVAAYVYRGLWPGSTYSIYGLASGTSTTDNTTIQVVCESCHRFNGAATTSNHSLVGNYGNAFAAASTDVGLCRLCHLTGQDTVAAGTDGWGTGWITGAGRAAIIAKTHPLESLQTTGAAVQTTRYPVLGGNVSYPTASRINCESCHAGHGTFPGVGAMILEGVASTANYSGNATLTVPPAADGSSWFPTTKNEAGFCLYCHTQ